MKAKLRMNAILILASILMTGCWSHYELTDLGFVMGVAIDTKQDGTVQITTQYYLPKGGKDKSQGGGNSSFNVTSSGDTVLTAIRGITGVLGRRSQWSHMRVILISEDTARRTKLGDLLEIFYRDPEPRLTASIMITKGNAQSYLMKKPLIEQTTSQQISKSKEALTEYAAQSVNSNLLDLGKQLRDQTGNAVIAYVIPDGDKGFKVNGSALIKKDRMVGTLPAEELGGYLMILNGYKYGLIEVPCSKTSSGQKRLEIVELTDFKSKLAFHFEDDRLMVSVQATGKGSPRELKCTSFNKVEDERAFEEKTEMIIKEEMKRTFETLQEKKMDVLKIGNKVFQEDQRLWSNIQPDWENYFSKAKLEVEVSLTLENTGTAAGKPIFTK